MGIIDFVILALVVAGVVAVAIRTKRKGVCADCAEGGCGGSCPSCGHGKECPATADPAELDAKLGKGL